MAGSVSALVAQATAMGQQGYAYVSGVAGNANDMGNLYFKDSTRTGSRLTYAADAAAVSVPQLITALNARGADGWAYKSDLAFGNDGAFSLFVKDSARPAKYSYAADAAGANWAAELAQFNSRGSQGYRFIGPITYGTTGAISNLYMRSSSPPATYSYATQPVPAAGSSAAQFEAVLDNMGAQRAVFIAEYGSADGSSMLLFEKSSLQAATLDYDVTAIPAGESLVQSVARANTKAAQGFVHVGDYADSSGSSYSVYVKGMTLPQRQPLSGIVYP